MLIIALEISEGIISLVPGPSPQERGHVGHTHAYL